MGNTSSSSRGSPAPSIRPSQSRNASQADLASINGTNKPPSLRGSIRHAITRREPSFKYMPPPTPKRDSPTQSSLPEPQPPRPVSPPPAAHAPAPSPRRGSTLPIRGAEIVPPKLSTSSPPFSPTPAAPSNEPSAVEQGPTVQPAALNTELDVTESSSRDLRDESPSRRKDSDRDMPGSMPSPSRSSAPSPTSGLPAFLEDRRASWSSAVGAVESTIERMKEHAMSIARETAERRRAAREEEDRSLAERAARLPTPTSYSEVSSPASSRPTVETTPAESVVEAQPEQHVTPAPMSPEPHVEHEISAPEQETFVQAQETLQEPSESAPEASVATLTPQVIESGYLSTPPGLEQTQATTVADVASESHDVSEPTSPLSPQLPEDPESESLRGRRGRLLSLIAEESESRRSSIIEARAQSGPHVPGTLTFAPRRLSVVTTADSDDQGYGTQEEGSDVGHEKPFNRARSSTFGRPRSATLESIVVESEVDSQPQHLPGGIAGSTEWLLQQARESVHPEPPQEKPSTASSASSSPVSSVASSHPDQPWIPPASVALEPGAYVLTDHKWGAALDLHGGNNRSAIAFGLHGFENQQWEVVHMGDGFALRNVRERSWLSIDLPALAQTGIAPALSVQWPVCWEVEAHKLPSSEEQGDDSDEDVLVRIRWPGTDYLLGLSDSTAGTPVTLSVGLGASAVWRASARPRPQITLSPPLTTENTMSRVDNMHGRVTVTTTTTYVTTTTKSITRITSTEA
ncbi:unnamed protein product [Peniophora sp. CBMAI 1063]|nr:unnamed protein product [Peniophora sp. CBMAI 1063]